MFDVRPPTPAEIEKMTEAGNAYRQAIADMVANPTPAARDRVQAMGMAFHHHVRLHAPFILERLTVLTASQST